MLLAVKPVDGDSYAGECVFMMMPQNGALVESDLGVVISELKVAGEHSCRVTLAGDRFEVVVTPRSLPRIRVVRDTAGENAIMTSIDGVDRVIGAVGA